MHRDDIVLCDDRRGMHRDDIVLCDGGRGMYSTFLHTCSVAKTGMFRILAPCSWKRKY